MSIEGSEYFHLRYQSPTNHELKNNYTVEGKKKKTSKISIDGIDCQKCQLAVGKILKEPPKLKTFNILRKISDKFALLFTKTAVLRINNPNNLHEPLFLEVKWRSTRNLGISSDEILEAMKNRNGDITEVVKEHLFDLIKNRNFVAEKDSLYFEGMHIFVDADNDHEKLTEAVNKFSEAAEKGSKEACYQLSLFEDIDPQFRKKYLKIAADQNHPQAAFEYALLLKNSTDAKKYFKKAADEIERQRMELKAAESPIDLPLTDLLLEIDARLRGGEEVSKEQMLWLMQIGEDENVQLHLRVKARELMNRASEKGLLSFSDYTWILESYYQILQLEGAMNWEAADEFLRLSRQEQTVFNSFAESKNLQMDELLNFLRKSFELSEEPVPPQLLTQLGLSYANILKDEEAVHLLEEAAKKGDDEANYHLALYYSRFADKKEKMYESVEKCMLANVKDAFSLAAMLSNIDALQNNRPESFVDPSLFSKKMNSFNPRNLTTLAILRIFKTPRNQNELRQAKLELEHAKELIKEKSEDLEDKEMLKFWNFGIVLWKTLNSPMTVHSEARNYVSEQELKSIEELSRLLREKQEIQ